VPKTENFQWYVEQVGRGEIHGHALARTLASGSSKFQNYAILESPLFGKHQGSQGLLKFTARYKESHGGAQVRHVMSNVSFSIAGDRAVGGCYLNYYHCKDGKVSLSALGRYEDQLRKVDGEWRFESRKVHLDGHA